MEGFDDDRIVIDDDLDHDFDYDSDAAYRPFFNIGGCIYFEDELDRILDSKDPKDIEHLNSLIKEIVERDHRGSFVYFILQGYKIGVLNNDGQTAAHLAFYSDSTKILTWNHGALLGKCVENINYTDRYGLSHLHISCIVGNVDVVKRFVDNHEDLNVKFTRENSDYDGFTPLHFAVINHRIEIVQLLLQNGANVNALDSMGRTSLHAICRVSENFSKLLVKDLTRQTTWSTELDIVKFLLDNRCNLNAKDDNGNTALLSLFQDDYYRKENWFLLGYDVTLKDDMIKDLRTRQKVKLEVLLEYGADVTIINNNGDSVLHSIIRDTESLRFPVSYSRISFDDKIYSEVIQRILDVNPKIDVNAKNKSGDCPLQLAVKYLSPAIVEILLNHGADSSQLRFDYSRPNFFRYPNIVPNLQAVQNVIRMIDLLIEDGYSFSLEDNLTILKFFVHNANDCECAIVREHTTHFNICSYVNYGSSMHTKYMLDKVISTLLFEGKLTLKGVLLVFVKEQLIYRQIADFYIDPEILPIVEDIPVRTSELNEMHEKLDDEVEAAKSFKLNDNTSLYDVMTKHPHEIFLQIKDCDFDKLPDKIDTYGDIVRGHMTRALVRHYIQNSAYDYSKVLFFSAFPDVCFQKILEYLSNEDILNFCLAAMIEQ